MIQISFQWIFEEQNERLRQGKYFYEVLGEVGSMEKRSDDQKFT